MLLVKTSSGEVEQFPYTLGDFRRDNAQTSFPRIIPTEMLAGYGVYPVAARSKPSFNLLTQTLTRNTLPTYQTDCWTVGWIVTDLPDDVAASNVRSLRDSKLRETDWMANSDVTMSDAWRTYRQALRDVPSQLPSTTITWPSEPS